MQNLHEASTRRKSRRDRSAKSIWEIAKRKVRIQRELSAIRARIAAEKGSQGTPKQAA
jgi:hypothetical protein